MRTSITTNTGVEIYYKDWGTGRPIVFSHAWPLSSDEWDAQMLFFLEQGFRVIAHDRRGHGRSSITDEGNDVDHYAADLAALTKTLDLRDAIHVGHSLGGAEVVRYAARCGHGRVAKIVLISSVTPCLMPNGSAAGISRTVFDDYRRRMARNRAQFFYELASGPYYGFNRPGVETAQGLVDNWWRQGMRGGIKPQYDGIYAFSETDLTEDLRSIKIPALVLHGDDDQVVPHGCTSELAAALLPNATLKIYPGYPHGMSTSHSDTLNADILEFIRGGALSSQRAG